MVFAGNVLKHIFKYRRQLGIGCGIFTILIGLYCLITGIKVGRGYVFNPGMGYILLGISFITMNFLEWKPKLMFICTSTALVLALWILIFKSGDDTIKHAVVRQQETVEPVSKLNNIPGNPSKDKVLDPVDVLDSLDDSTQAGTSGVLDALGLLLPPEIRDDPTFRKVAEVTSSGSFQKQLKEQAPLTPKEYIDLLVEHGVTELSEMDIEKEVAETYDFMAQKYQTKNPGKAPEEKDEVMAKRFGEVLKEYGVVDGIRKITTNQENVLWIGARFKGDEAAFNEWWADVVAVYEVDDAVSPSLGPIDSEFSRKVGVDISSDLPDPDVSFAERETSAAEVREDSIIPNTETGEAAIPAVDPEKVITKVSPEPPLLPTDEGLETSLKVQFSSDRLERAMSILERYGPEEGLRRLRESDPEIAEQVEQKHNRKDREEDDR